MAGRKGRAPLSLQHAYRVTPSSYGEIEVSIRANTDEYEGCVLCLKAVWATVTLPRFPFDVALLVQVHITLLSGDDSASKPST